MQKRRQILFCMLYACVLVGTVALAFGTTPPLPLVQGSNGSTVQAVSFAQYSKIDLNTATTQQLCMLSGIGEAKAQYIIEYRVLVGSFASVQDVANVSGITQQMVAEWGDQVFVSQAQ